MRGGVGKIGLRGEEGESTRDKGCWEKEIMLSVGQGFGSVRRR